VKSEQVESNRVQTVYLDTARISGMMTPRPEDGHKGTFGTLLVWAGSEGMGGAAYMCANAACRSGVGLVHLWVSREWMTPMFLALPQAIAHPIPDDFPRAREELSAILPKMSACVIGPGLRADDPTVREGILYMLENARLLVADAGALTVIAREPDVFRPVFLERTKRGLPPVILTPHPGEFAGLLPHWDKNDRINGAQAFSHEWNAIVVLKGHQTVICTPAGACYINTTGNDGLAKGGSGDVLSGLIGSLLAQGMSPEDAAVAGVFVHGLAGDIAAAALGRRYMQPTDLFAFFTDAFRVCMWEITPSQQGE
jgi:hydroxyethylthiazole kinase-like uncharacterized protein yjeF